MSQPLRVLLAAEPPVEMVPQQQLRCTLTVGV
jgi:hypothetical protein